MPPPGNAPVWSAVAVMQRKLRPSKRGRRRTAPTPPPTVTQADPEDDLDGLLSAVSADVPAADPEAQPVSNGTRSHTEASPQIAINSANGALGVQGEQKSVPSVNGNHARALPSVQLALPSPPPAVMAATHASATRSTYVATPDTDTRLRSYLGDTGYMQIFAGLQEGHLDVYFEYASTWCPVLDRQTVEADPSIRQSLLLRHALALCANQISPSLLHRSSSAEHYARAKALFYENQEPNPLLRIMAVMLFYWWSGEPPNVVSLDNTSWWTGTAIRVAQQIGLHHSSCSPISAFKSSRTSNFNRDVHGLHLTYLSAITLLHLSKDALPLPKASVGAIVAASCTTRIFHDYLVRGSVSFLAGQCGWYIAIAILALLHARRLEGLRAYAEADIQILRAAMSAMAETWHSARVWGKNFAKLLDTDTDPLPAVWTI
ncbi:hypothetical protein SEUCBS140593_005362 [Sporothrix eucalyptigena]|uniref:Transcription factor domain-containing protein n=1 Tax=Sporothrix eucalyptigena TaxID=1812306 RepID=A0ABP0BVV0_9PEZI